MKSYVIKTAKAELLIVEMPRVYDYELTKEGLFVKDYGSHLSDYIEGSYSLLGKPDRISEEDADDLVEKETFCHFNGKEYTIYRNYEEERSRGINWMVKTREPHKTAKESMLSLLSSEIYWENPYREKVFANMGISASMVRAANREIYSEKWHEAEQKTFDRNRSLIFKKK